MEDALTCPKCAESSRDLEAVDCPSCGFRLVPYTPKPIPVPGRGPGRPRKAGSERRSALNGRQRAEYGVTMTFAGDDGPFSLHEKGPMLEAVRVCCNRALELDAEAKVVTISTPDSVLGDLRRRNDVGYRKDRFEASMLSRAGLREMLSAAHDRSRERWSR